MSEALKALALILLLVANASAAQQSASARVRVGGVVRDSAGVPIRGAEVSLTAGVSDARRVATGDDGRFVFDGVSATEGKLTVEAQGFARREVSWRASGADAAEIEIVLGPQPVNERVTVTATRTELKFGEAAASVTVLPSETLNATAAVTLDDALRQVPGFQLFRRTGSRAANPTTQGVSLRGVGASGASRALVLVDGVPLNDPFGGWVYWGRVPRRSVESIEVLRGGASDLYGSSAMGGVVNVLTRRIEDEKIFDFEASYGSQQTLDASLFTGARKGGWVASLAAESFHTGGYYLISREERGRADTPAATRHTALTVTLEREINLDLRFFARGSYFGEARDNGTQLQRNRTHLRQAIVGADWRHADAGTFNFRAHASTQVFDQSFSAVAEDRHSETLTRNQRVPSQSVGFSAQWSRAFAPTYALAVGFEAREVRGASDELAYVAGRPSSKIGAGGKERSAGVFVENILRPSPKLLLTIGGRFDRWRNQDALAASSPIVASGPASVTVFPDRTESAFSPRASVLYGPVEGFSIHASAYRAFRAPTLNELYRSFRVGNVLTLANENLRAEHLTGGETGARFISPEKRFATRATLFWMEVTRPVANVTLSETPSLITRQRQSLGRTRSMGVEVEADANLNDRWTISGGYQLTSTKVVRFPANAALEGLRIPQVPIHTLTFRTDYTVPRRYVFSLQGRLIGEQFDDDLNRFRLERFFTLDAHASRRLGDSVEIFVATENLLNTRYQVGRTPLTTLGPPLLIRLGLRFRLDSR